MENPAPLQTDMGLKEKNHCLSFIEGDDQNLYQIDIYKKPNEIYIKCQNTTNELKQIYYSYHLSLFEIRNNTPFENLIKAFDIFKTFISIGTSFIENKENFLILNIIISKDKKPFQLKLEKKEE